MQRYLLSLSLFVLLFATGCDKYRNYSEAIVINTGNITNTGCGYLLQLSNGDVKKPVYLPSAFQHDSIHVVVKYISTGNLNYCNSQVTYDVVEIEDIQRDL